MLTDKQLSEKDDDFTVIHKVELDLEPQDIYDYVAHFTDVHSRYSQMDKNRREIECLKVMYPRNFRAVHKDEYTIGELRIMPVGIGCTTTVGGVGYYAQMDALEELKRQLPHVHDMDDIIAYWKENDSRERFFKENLITNELGRFVETEFPAIVTTRLSGMFLNYNLLCDLGISGLKEKIIEKKSQSTFHECLLESLDLFTQCIDAHIQSIQEHCPVSDKKWGKMLVALQHIRTEQPNSFLEALELTWLYSLVSNVINYGRMDDYLGDFLVHDLEQGNITWNEALLYVRTLFEKMEQRRTLANSRVIIGGKGRRHEKNADVFCLLAIEAVMANRDIEPQLTLRYYDGMNPEVYEKALACIELGTTFPIIYNDDVNIPAIAHAMRVDEKTAMQYLPLGCGEINLSGCGVSTPNTCMNMLKILTIVMNEGIDPYDGLKKTGPVHLKPLREICSFDDFFHQYKALLHYYVQICANGQSASYRYLNEDISFLYTSLLIDDCIERDKPVLGGGARYLGGTNETYGNISTGDALYAVKKLVFEKRLFSLEDIKKACLDNFENHEHILGAMQKLNYYGNDCDEVDLVQQELHNFVCQSMRNEAQRVGLDYYLVVMINNQIGTVWGMRTWASANGRYAKTYMSNGNNPQSGMDKNGPTAMLTSLTKLRPDIHAGAVHNLKISKELFKEKRDVVKALLATYFEKGAQIMITVVGKEELQDAFHHPEKYPNLIVRVGGFSARFVDLNKEVQKEIMERTLN